MVPTTSRSDVTPRPRRGMTSAEVQTAMDGLLYSWDPAGSGVAFPGIPYGLHFVDPTPIATHVVSADSLEGKEIEVLQRFWFGCSIVTLWKHYIIVPCLFEEKWGI